MKSSIALQSFRYTPVAFCLSKHPPPSLFNTWCGCGYFLGQNQDMVLAAMSGRESRAIRNEETEFPSRMDLKPNFETLRRAWSRRKRDSRRVTNAPGRRTRFCRWAGSIADARSLSEA